MTDRDRTRLTQKQKAALTRRATRRAAAAILSAMADADVDFKTMAKMLGCREREVAAKFMGYVHGTNVSLDTLSDMMLCCGVTPDFALRQSETDALRAENKELVKRVDLYARHSAENTAYISKLQSDAHGWLGAEQRVKDWLNDPANHKRITELLDAAALPSPVRGE